MASTSRPRRFAPLDPSASNTHNAPLLLGIVFDMDGTLCLPQNYMFGEMRAALEIPKSVDILTHIESLSATPDQDSSSPKSRAQDAIRSIERQAMTRQQPQPGLNELITHMSSRGLKLGLCTRNFELPVDHLLEKFVSDEGRRQFSPLITRETQGVKPKPSPEGIWACLDAWTQEGNWADEDNMRKRGEALIMVGDSIDDIEAGARAGAATVLLVNEDNRHLLDETQWPKHVDLAIERLDDLISVLENGFEGRA